MGSFALLKPGCPLILTANGAGNCPWRMSRTCYLWVEMGNENLNSGSSLDHIRESACKND